MSSKLVKVMIEFVKEDPQCWEGLRFTKTSDPVEAGQWFLDYLSDGFDEIEISRDGLGLGDILRRILDSHDYSGPELIDIGNGVIVALRTS